MSDRFFSACLCILGSLFVSLASSAQVTIMPLGDSATAGVDYYTDTSGCWRDPLVHDLSTSGFNFTLVGANNGGTTPYLTSTGNTYHNGYGFYKIDDILNNLSTSTQPNPGDYNEGGYWITGGGGTGRAAVHPTIILLEIGANDIIYQSDPQTANPSVAQFEADMETRLYTLVTTLHSQSLTPDSIIVVAQIYPFNNSPAFDQEIVAYNSYIKNTLVPSLSYTRTVDNYTPFLNPDGSVNGLLLGTDNVHPTRYGYPLIAQNFAAAVRAIENANPATYALTVAGGTGSGSYPAGEVVTINSASPPSGNQFSSWTPGITALSDVQWPIATFTMPAVASMETALYTTSGAPFIPNGTYQIVGAPVEFQFSYANGLSIGAASATAGAQVQEQTYTGAATQQWDLNNLGNNVVELTLKGTNLAMSVIGASTAAGAYLDVENYTGATSQQWTIVQTLGTTQIVNVNSGMSIDLTGYVVQSGFQLSQYYANYNANQLWAFYPTAFPVVTSSDTPTMSIWGLGLMAVLFCGVAWFALSRPVMASERLNPQPRSKSPGH